MKVVINLDLFQGHGVCADECPEAFAVEERPGRYPKVVVLQERPPDELHGKVGQAVKYCPTHAIRIETD